MLRYATTALLVLVGHLALAQCNELFISEYVEGLDNNKALEIYNPTNAAVNLADYRLVRWVNGSTTADQSPNFTVQLTGTVGPNSVYVAAINRVDTFTTGGGLGGPEIDPALYSAVLSAPSYGFYSAYYDVVGNFVLDFNGDDAISLEKWNGFSYDKVDIFGLIGERPVDLQGMFGVGWSDVFPYWQTAGPYITMDHTLIRKQTVLEGVTVNPGVPYTGAWDVSDQWDDLSVNTFADLGYHVCDCQTTSGCNDLFFSEIVEGSGNNKAFEIYNPNPFAVNLAGYSILRYNNGALTPSGGMLNLSGVINANDVWVVVNSQMVSTPNSPACDPALQALADQLGGTYPAPTFNNGNDAITLEYNNLIVDVFGKIGEDPGTAWSDGNGVWWTKDHTLVRKASVTQGVSTNPSVFDVTLEWDTLPEDTWTELGQHVSSCANGPCTFNGAVSTTDVSCEGGNDGTATATGSTGTAPYSYAWSASAGLQSTSTAIALSAGSHSVTITDALGCIYSGIAIVAEPPVLSAVLTPVNPACGASDGIVSANGFGGNGTYSYLWSTGGTSALISGLNAGSYTVTVTDAQGCTVTESTTLFDNGAPSITDNASDATCFGACNGTAIITATGGTTPFTYQWSTGESTPVLSGLCAGDYSLTVTDANGCAIAHTTTIGQPIQMSLSVNGASAGCGQSDGSASVLASGGAGTFSYLWSTGGTTANIVGLAAGSYTVTVTDDNGCVGTGFAVISNPNSPSISTSTVDESCAGVCDGSASVVATGGTPSYTYLWSNGSVTNQAQDLCTGTEFLTVTDAQNCSNVGAIVINSAPTTVVADFSCANTVYLNQGATIQIVNSSTGANTFSWDYGDGNGSTLQNPTYSYSAVGSYDVTLIASSSGCADTTSQSVEVELSIGIGAVENQPEFQLFPNPSRGAVTLLLDGEFQRGTIAVFDAIGNRVWAKQLLGNNELTLPAFAPGAYMVQVRGTNSVATCKLLLLE